MRATTIAGPLVEGPITTRGGLDFQDSAPSTGANVASAAVDPTRLYLAIRFRSALVNQWADLGGYIHALAFLARGYGLDTCPQEAWARLYDTVGGFLKLPDSEILFCGVAIGYGDRKHKANDFRSPRAELSEFCKFYGFD